MRGQINYVKRDVLLKFHVKHGTYLISRHTKLKFAKKALEKVLNRQEQSVREFQSEEYKLTGVKLENQVKRIMKVKSTKYRIVVKHVEYVPAYYPNVIQAAKKHGLN